MYTALTIAGSDSSGGAGIQADIKTMCAHGIYAMSAITALTAQNTTGVSGIFEASPEFLGQQLDAVFTDIFPDAVKIGMLSGKEIIQVVAEKLSFYKAKNIVLDPVMVSTSGSPLIKKDAIETMITELFPLARIITPNIPEAEVLTGIAIKNQEQMIEAGKLLYKKINEQKAGARGTDLLARTRGTVLLEQSLETRGTDLMAGARGTDLLARTRGTVLLAPETAVLVKGGHSINDANDLLITSSGEVWIKGERINNPNTHGTGCTLSSAIACNLAKGIDLETAIRNAKQYLSNALRDGLDLGNGSGPVNHLYKITGEI